MCTSKCSGSCLSLLKDKRIDSEESLIELKGLLDNLSACDSSVAGDKSHFLYEVMLLKKEARRLLGEINYYGESALDGKGDSVNIFEDLAFEVQLNNLKHKIHLLYNDTVV